MHSRRKKVALMVVAGVLVLGLATLVWAVVSTVGMPNGMQGDVALGAVDDSESTRTSMPTAGTAADSEWTVIVDGFVESPLNLTMDDIVAMPTSTVYADLYCVGLPTRPLVQGDWTGVRLGFILEQAGVLPEAVKVAFYADDGFSTDLTVTTAMREDIILAYERDGEPLAQKQLVVPCRWGYKWIKEPTHIELVDYDFLGFYESMGYSDEAYRLPDDIDCDEVANEADNCESVPNPDQTDTDGDGEGDACDDDDDDDTVLDATDNCPLIVNAGQTDTDDDGWGDACDNCPTVATPWYVPAGDEDCDGFTTTVETYVSTDPADACSDDPGLHDAWPLDVNIDRSVTVVGDVLAYVGNIGLPVDGDPTLQRLDLNADGSVTTVGDVSLFNGTIGVSCT
jgi:hypothetical protein